MREVAEASVNIRTCTTWNLRLIYCRYLAALVFGPPGADIICFKKCSRQRGPPTTVLPILHGSTRRRSPTRLWPTVASLLLLLLLLILLLLPPSFVLEDALPSCCEIAFRHRGDIALRPLIRGRDRPLPRQQVAFAALQTGG